MVRILKNKAISLHFWEQSMQSAQRLRGTKSHKWCHRWERMLVHVTALGGEQGDDDTRHLIGEADDEVKARWGPFESGSTHLRLSAFI
jgi:hypothetical protein